jgi:hypothetical protein
MNHRPRSVTIISWIFIAVGAIALTYHLLPRHIGELKDQRSLEHGLVWVLLIRFLAIVGGVFMLIGHNWARWLLVAWMIFHFVLSFFHDSVQVVVHGLLFGVILFFLFRPQASAYFRSPGAKPPGPPRTEEPTAP